jgi:hypothetical protein
MPSQTNVYDAAPQAKPAKGLLGLLKAQARPSRQWIGQSTVRALGDTWSSSTRRSARRPVFE